LRESLEIEFDCFVGYGVDLDVEDIWNSAEFGI
jgi:hypothetical protein